MNDYDKFVNNYFASRTPKPYSPFGLSDDLSFYSKYDYQPIQEQRNLDINPTNSQINPQNNQGFFNSDGFKTAMGGLGMLGSALSGIGSVLQANAVRKYNKEVLNMQKEQAQRNMQREDANNKALNDGLKNFFKEKSNL